MKVLKYGNRKSDDVMYDIDATEECKVEKVPVFYR